MAQYAFAAVILNGVFSSKINVAIPGNVAPYLRVVREGDVWTLQRSLDGDAWATAGSFTQALEVAQVGVFSGNLDQAEGYAARIDYFEIDSDPITDEDGGPIAGDDTVEASLGTALTIDVATDLLGNDGDPSNQPLVLEGTGQPQNGTLVNNGDGTLTYTPSGSFVGTDSFDYTVAGRFGTATATVTVNVVDPNSVAPIAADDAVTTAEDESVEIAPLGGDFDPDGDAITIVATSSPSNGTLIDNGDGTLTYSPNSDFYGTDTFTYSITDGRGRFDTASVTITVVAVNDAPIATGEAVQVPAGIGAHIISVADLLSNDDDAEGDTLTLASYSQPKFGSLADNQDGTLTYTPAAGFVGMDKFTYTAGDGSLTSDPATVWIDVGLPAGVFSDDFNTNVVRAGWQLQGPEGAASVERAGVEAYLEIAVPHGNHDAWQTNQATRLMQDAEDEDFVVEAKFLSRPAEKYQMQGILIEQDAANWLRFDTVHDGQKLSIFAGSTQGGTSSQKIKFQISQGAADYLRVEREGDLWTLSYSADGEVWNVAGSFARELTVSQTGVFAGSADSAPGYTARVDYFFNSAAPIIPEDDIPVAPEAHDDVIVTGASMPVVINVASELLGNDTDANDDPLSFAGFAAPSYGALADNGDGSLTYTPASGFIGVDSFTYYVSDGTFQDAATVWIGVDNNAPQAGNDFAVTDEDTPILIDVLANDQDADGDPLHVSATSAAPNGTVTINSDGTLSYIPDPDFYGTDSFTYTVTDRVRSTEGMVTVSVTPVPDAPVAVNDVLAGKPDTPISINPDTDLLANDSDGDGDQLTLAMFTQPTHGTLVDNGDGTLTYTPDQGFEGTDSFTYTVSDGTGLTDTAIASIVVADPIDVWYGTDQTFGAPGEGQRWINILGNVDSSQVSSLSYSLNDGPQRSLSMGPDTRRLQENGDFNIDIDYSALDGSTADDVVTIRAVLADGSVATKDVTIIYEDGNRYPTDYSIDWSTVTNIQDVAQIVDGKWSLTGDGIRLSEPGYDRFVTVGDQHWDFYEVALSITAHDLTTEDPRGRDGGVFGLGMLWTGHTDDPISGWQPKSGWNPSELIFFDSTPNERLRFFGRQGDYPVDLEEGASYEIVFRVEQSDLINHTYKMKIWEAGTDEPAGWVINRTIAYDEPQTGSLMLLSHYYDVTFHDLSVTEIDGGDILMGSEGADLLVAVDLSNTAPGRGERDVLVGKAGADVFVFGDSGGTYYDDGVATDLGLGDFGYIWDFNPGEDVIRLSGTPSDYRLAADFATLPSGTSIWQLGSGSSSDELIAVLRDTYGLDLSGDEFEYINIA